MARNWDKFCLLLWKNWLLQWRHKLQTLVEIMAPVLFSCLLVLIRSLVEPEHKPDSIYAPFKPLDTDFPNIMHWKLRGRTNINTTCDGVWYLAWSPHSEVTEELMDNVAHKLAGQEALLKHFNDSRSLKNFLTDPLQNNMLCTLAGIDFGDSLKDAKTLPKSMNFSLQFPSESRAASSDGPRSSLNNWRTNLLFPLFQLPGPRDPTSEDGGNAPGYNPEGFLSLQQAISLSIAEYHKATLTSGKDIPAVELNRYPYPSYIDDPLLLALQAFISIVIMLSFVYTCISTVKVITTEKELQLKEAMKIMGLPNWLHWTAWFLKTFTFTTVSVILIVTLVKVQWYTGSDLSVFTFADGTVIFVFLLLYMFASICFCFMLSVFFSKANTAAAIAGLAWFLSYAPYLFMQQEYESLNLAQKIAASLASNTAMAYGMQLMLMHEGTGAGIQWSNIWAPVTPDDNFYMGHIMLMLVADGIIYLIITLYVEAIFPGQYGVPQPWYFPFTASYWCGEGYKGVEDASSARSIHDDIIEADPEGMRAGIQVKQLRKVYDNKKVAVEGLNLNMFEDQITVLLGHNGAGKTTTMSMITGMFPPTGGTALVNGHDIRTDIEGVRDSLGLCPQHNVLFAELTVREHLYFFAKLKGLRGAEIETEINHYIDLLELRPKADSPSSTLSGGMQRKLSVGVALCGGSKVVLCDEPTSGMDPAARRALWDLLASEKKGRTILLSTHFMDEADLLGDRIAIMSGGQLKCAGSSFFLKKKFGAGYHLVIVKDTGCEVEKVTELLRKYMPDIVVETDIGTELSYSLDENQSRVFESMLSDLENHTNDLKLLSYGVSLTTLEEVFMKVGADHSGDEPYLDTPANGDGPHANGHSMDGMNRNQFKASSARLLTGVKLSLNQFKAMLVKKFIIWHRNWLLFVIQNIIMVACLIITIIVARTMGGDYDLPGLNMNFSPYDKSHTVIQDNSETSDISDILEQYKTLIPKSHHSFEVMKEKNMSSYILKTVKGKIPTYNMQYLVGASFEGGANAKITSWFNNQPYHALSLSLNLVYNAILKGLFGPDYSIKVVNRPLPFAPETKIQKLAGGNNMGFQLAFNTGFSMAFVSAFYILFCVRERVCKAKHLQFVSGVEVLTFWCSSFLWDLMSYTVTCLLWVITIAPFQQDGFASGIELGRALFVLLSFGWAMLPMIYIASFLFDIPSTGFVRMTLISIFTGVATFMVVEILNQPGLNLEHIGSALHWVFLLIPHYGVSSAFKNLNDISGFRKMCELLHDNRPEIPQEQLCKIWKFCCYDESTYFRWEEPGIGRNLLYFFLVGVVLFLVLILIEFRVGQKMLYKLRKLNKAPPPMVSEDGVVDSDVQAEKSLVHAMERTTIKDHSLVLNDFTKYYGDFLAVNQLCVGVRNAECFGLLGINGAGKTSTFKMLTGDEMISSGDAWVNGMSLKTDMKQVHQVIGYCPQFDALIDELTGRETLVMFCQLRGVPPQAAKTLANKLAHELNFNQHIDKKVREYSGGNKRKLSTAIALIGEPSVVYLDEPTTGMDPAAKRHLWNAMCRIRDSGTCIVLTSHSMEECEALCTRLAVMVNGEFKCLGSTQHLKNKFSKGYTLIVKLRKENSRRLTSAGGSPLATPTSPTPFFENDGQAGDVNLRSEMVAFSTDAVNTFIMQNFPTAILKESHQCLLTYYIPSTDIPWSRMFGVMESGKVQLGIEDYSLGQTTLEQVFLSFTKKQRSEETSLP